MLSRLWLLTILMLPSPVAFAGKVTVLFEAELREYTSVFVAPAPSISGWYSFETEDVNLFEGTYSINARTTTSGISFSSIHGLDQAGPGFVVSTYQDYEEVYLPGPSPGNPSRFPGAPVFPDGIRYSVSFGEIKRPERSDSRDGVFDGDGVADDIDRDGQFGPNGFEEPDIEPGAYVPFVPIEYPTHSLPAAAPDVTNPFAGIRLVHKDDEPEPEDFDTSLAPFDLDLASVAEFIFYAGDLPGESFYDDDGFSYRHRIVYDLTLLTVTPEPTTAALLLMACLAPIRSRAWTKSRNRAEGVGR
ncbi:MAG: hypothetical protein AAGA92_12600 [Planctomycetota bacterium]